MLSVWVAAIKTALIDHETRLTTEELLSVSFDASIDNANSVLIQHDTRIVTLETATTAISGRLSAVEASLIATGGTVTGLFCSCLDGQNITISRGMCGAFNTAGDSVGIKVSALSTPLQIIASGAWAPTVAVGSAAIGAAQNVHVFLISASGTISFRVDTSPAGANIKAEAPGAFIRRIGSFPVVSSMIVKSKRVSNTVIIPLELISQATTDTAVSSAGVFVKLTGTDDSKFWLGAPNSASVFISCGDVQGGIEVPCFEWRSDLSDSTNGIRIPPALSSNATRVPFDHEVYEKGGARGLFFRLVAGYPSITCSAAFEKWIDDRSDF